MSIDVRSPFAIVILLPGVPSRVQVIFSERHAARSLIARTVII